ncbi:DUF4184 family protein [Pedobacter frigiditerrae]|uniref:DUF4184 family protein n=1 Tax=Pedobacter frigiditerrae TaxID=2530452 RepID=A0A4V2MJ81_9SPHI|nr:DUF4184 family protein [Pedobacter frigiditerrae]TCC93226.1 DUF4184 family protein [Pedobacter frigiditerrae]
MPFTFSHPAIVLPLSYLPKRWISLTGLVMGSLTPDFEYFIRMRIKSEYSHTLGGLFWFDLPLGLLLAFLFHLIARNALIGNSPIFLKGRFSVFKDFDWIGYFKENWIIVCFSVLIGAFSHLFWDSFTHDTGYFVRRMPLLLTMINFLGLSISVHKIIQHSSTVVGAIVILFSILKLPKQEVLGKINFNYWLLILCISLLIVLLRILCGLPFQQYGNVLVTGMSGLMISLILTPILMKNKSI